jgi:ParB/RepB/Spo0J family partition protein
MDIKKIKENPVALRLVNKNSLEYIELKDSIARLGILNAIGITDTYTIIDGLHRYSAALDLGLIEIPVVTLSLSESEQLEAQLIANIHHITTTPLEVTKQIHRILAANPLMSLTDISVKLCKSITWVKNRLNLLKLEPSLVKLVESGTISITNAIALSKLPHKEQLNYKEQATELGSDRFPEIAAQRLKEIKYSQRKGRHPGPFVPILRVRKIADIKSELETQRVSKQLTIGMKNIPDAFHLGVQWAVNLDPDSQKLQIAQQEEKLNKIEAAKNQRRLERIKLQAEEARNQ